MRDLLLDFLLPVKLVKLAGKTNKVASSFNTGWMTQLLIKQLFVNRSGSRTWLLRQVWQWDGVERVNIYKSVLKIAW